MGWNSALRKPATPAPVAANELFARPQSTPYAVNFSKLVVIDFETYYDKDYTLKKLSTSEYIRDPRFKALMMGIKIGRAKTKVVPTEKIPLVLKNIDWKTYGLLCHNTSFDGFILSHHYKVVPSFYFDTLSMARGLHKNDIGAGLNDVAEFYGAGSKIEGALESVVGVSTLTKDQFKVMADYCAQDVELTLEIFKQMLPLMPDTEMVLIDRIVRMFADPVLKVDLPRVARELERELREREEMLLRVANVDPGDADAVERARKMISSSQTFASLLESAGARAPMKVSPAWMKLTKAEREEKADKKWTYAFSKSDEDFLALREHASKRVRDLVAARFAVKSTIGATRAERFLKAGANGMSLPVLLHYYGAHTGRMSAGNKMNMQNLERGSELRRSIMAPKGYRIVVADSGQIEARMNAWLWGEEELLSAFRLADAKLDRDAYCKFADNVYNRVITKADEKERFVGKVCVLALGYQMGAERLRKTLALGLMGPPVQITLEEAQHVVNIYRSKNSMIKRGWQRCEEIIGQMWAGREDRWKCLNWEREKIWLPNGMALKYPNLGRESDLRKITSALLTDDDNPWVDEEQWKDGWVYTRKGALAKIYGGLLCENLVQALARIVVTDQLLTIAQKYRVVMFTHDEIVTCVPEKQADKAYAFMHKVMSTPPAWAPDIPLNADGGHDVIYSK